MVNTNISEPRTPARKVPACGATKKNPFSERVYTCNAPAGHPGKHSQWDKQKRHLEARWK